MGWTTEKAIGLLEVRYRRSRVVLWMWMIFGMVWFLQILIIFGPTGSEHPPLDRPTTAILLVGPIAGLIVAGAGLSFRVRERSRRADDVDVVRDAIPRLQADLILVLDTAPKLAARLHQQGDRQAGQVIEVLEYFLEWSLEMHKPHTRSGRIPQPPVVPGWDLGAAANELGDDTAQRLAQEAWRACRKAT